MRHGHKSERRCFDGHKAAVVVDTDTRLITAVDVLAGNAWDGMGALELVERNVVSAGVPVVVARGHTAYGDGGTRQEFATRGAGWWPGCRAVPDGRTLPRKTSTSILRPTPAPVPPATSPSAAGLGELALTMPDAPCSSIPKKGFFRRLGHYREVPPLPSIASCGWW